MHIIASIMLIDQEKDGFGYRWHFFWVLGKLLSNSKRLYDANINAFWLKEIVSPYVKSVRDQLKTNAKCVINADRCCAHSSPEIDHFLNEIGNIEFIFIPPHSSHISQMIDATIFGTIKRRYSSTSIQDKYTRFIKKLLRIKRAYQSSMNEELIRSCWEATGFKLETNKGEVVKITFDDDFKEYLRTEASKNQQNQ